MAQTFVGTDMELRAHLLERHRYRDKRFPYTTNWNAEEHEPIFSTVPREEMDKLHDEAHETRRFRKGPHYHKEANGGQV